MHEVQARQTKKYIGWFVQVFSSHLQSKIKAPLLPARVHIGSVAICESVQRRGPRRGPRRVPQFGRLPYDLPYGGRGRWAAPCRHRRGAFVSVPPLGCPRLRCRQCRRLPTPLNSFCTDSIERHGGHECGAPAAGDGGDAFAEFLQSDVCSGAALVGDEAGSVASHMHVQQRLHAVQGV